MGDIDDKVAALQANIRTQREALDRIKPSARGYEPALQRLMEATAALVAYEKEIPAIEAEPDRLRSEQIITQTVRAFTSVILVLAVPAVLGVTHRGWLFLLVPLALLGCWMWLRPVDVVIAHHVAQRRGAILLAVLAVLAFILVIGLPVMGLPADWTFIVVAVVVIWGCLALSLLLLYGDDAPEDET
jgi:hypothetical protein